MAKARALNQKKYGITKYAFWTAWNYTMQYKEWIVEERRSGNAELRAKIEKIDSAIAEAAENKNLEQYLRYYVTNEGTTYRDLVQQGIPCGPSMFYQMRRKFYYLMSKKI